MFCLVRGGGGSTLASTHSNKRCELGFISLCMTPELLLSIDGATATEWCNRNSWSCVLCAGNASSVKDKGHPITCYRMHKEGVKVYLHLFLNSAPVGRGWVTPLPGKKPYDISQGAHQVRCGRAWRTEYLLHPPRFEPRTVTPVKFGKHFKVNWFISANNIFFLAFLILGNSPASEFKCWRFGTLFVPSS